MERSENDSTKKKINANNTISQRVTSFFRHFNNDLAIDLGTANTIIFKGNRIELNEPSIVAYDNNTNKIIAVGRNAQGMIGRVHKDITICKPMEEGVIANPYVAEGMLRAYINRVSNGSWARRIIVGVPSGITEAGMRIMRDSCEHAGAKEVHLITEPMASAIGMGLEVLEPKGNLIVDIGGGTTEIAVIALGGIVCKESIKTAGNVITKSILQYFRNRHNLEIGEATAEGLKIAGGSAYKMDKEASVVVKGRDIVTGIPKSIQISSVDLRENAINPSVKIIIDAIINLLVKIPPELASDIFDRGLWLTGGGALLRGLNKRIEEVTKLPVSIPENPLLTVALGTGIVLNNLKLYRNVLIKQSPYL
ncbi:MAG: rod shape-determining protein [Bacteroidetes bacterium]|nr:rod shape-determining protein [Bacteroidota bacterium]